jgi:hypothetical protein
MNDNERQFENLVRGIKFDDKPDYEHRDKLEQDLLAAMAKQTRHKEQSFKIWRTIMNSRITKLTAAAAVLILIAIVGWLSTQPGSPQPISSFTLLARASAAERMLFNSVAGITHIANEIILYPGQEHDVGKLLNDLESDVTQDKNIAFIKSWLSWQWIPVYSLGADGQKREIKLDLAKHTDKAITVSDLIWYDAVTGRFARVLKTGEQVLFANAYDGEFIYIANEGPDGVLQIEREAVTSEFRVPENPADFLGIAAGIKGAVLMEHYPPIQDVATETLEDGTAVRVYTMGFTDPWGKIDTYFVFKINTKTDVIDEIECVVKGKTTCVHQRLIAETVDSPELSWNLSELTTSLTESTIVNVEASAGANLVTIQQMVQRVTSPVYIFSADPSWTNDRKVYDLPDEMSAPARIFSATYRAKDGRDIVLTQGESFNRYFTTVFGNRSGQPVLSWTYESENGFKALHQGDKEGEMWWTEFALKSAGFEPRANRVGYILMSPARTFLVLAINGPISDQELKDLVDSLIPAEEYVDSSDQN